MCTDQRQHRPCRRRRRIPYIRQDLIQHLHTAPNGSDLPIRGAGHGRTSEWSCAGSYVGRSDDRSLRDRTRTSSALGRPPVGTVATRSDRRSTCPICTFLIRFRAIPSNLLSITDQSIIANIVLRLTVFKSSRGPAIRNFLIIFYRRNNKLTYGSQCLIQTAVI